ncbi:MAG: hypothetical protein WED12_01890 [Chloroflexota bacterium]
MTLTVERMQAITIDVDVGRAAVNYTEEELAFREEVKRSIDEIHARGGMIDFGPGETDF